MTEAHSITTQNRIYFLDNLRTFMIFLVVLLHVGGVYESSGFWALFWIVDDPATNELCGLINTILDIFVMSTIFFISGFFVPFSLGHNKAWSFLKSKFRRLMIPWAVAVLTLIPAYKFIFLYSRNLPQEDWTTYFHWSYNIWNQNWLWYLPVLFLFDVLYFAFSRMNISLSKVSLKAAVSATFIIGVAFSYVMDVFKLQGWTSSFFLHFQNERLLIYFMIFLLGALCNKRKIFEANPDSRKSYFLMSGIAWIPISIYSIFVTFAFTQPGQFITSATLDKLILWGSFNLSVLSLVYLMVATFRFYLNKPIRIWNSLNKYSYGVYIIHTIILGLMATALLNTIIPSIPKYLLVTVCTFIVSNLLVHFYKILKSKLITERKEIAMRKIAAAAMLIVSLITSVSCQKQDGPVEKQPPHVNIHIAALQGNLTAIQQHINAGSDLNIKDAYGSNPLIIATTFGKTDVAKALIKAGADLQVTDGQGSTPLHVAAFFCRTEIVEALLAKGADKTVRNNMGATALESVTPPFQDVKGIYDSIGNALKPLGLRLDYDRLEKTRPIIAAMLR